MSWRFPVLKMLGIVLLLALIAGVIVGPARAQMTRMPAFGAIPSLAEGRNRAISQKERALEIMPTEVTAHEEWQVLIDSDYQFTLEYPGTWHPMITIEVPRSGSRAEWILRRYSFIGGGLDIDIWAAHDNRELSSWLEWMGKVTAPFPVLKPNGVVAGYPAVAFVEDQMVSVFVSDGQFIYRFWLTLSIKENLEGYLHVLNTFRLPGTQTPGIQIPKPVMESAQQVLDFQHHCVEMLSGKGCYSVLYQPCCNIASAYCSNSFPCSRDNSTHQDRGNCTFYVCARYGAVPFRGNAGTWWHQVPRYASWRRGYLPQQGENIAWWGGDPGHVAYVDNYQGGNQVTISEMLWCNSCGRTRTIAVTDPGGYIWRVGGPTTKEP